MQKSLRVIMAAAFVAVGSCVAAPLNLLPSTQAISVAEAAGIINMTPAQQKEIDTFFTSFSSAGMSPFKKGTLTNDDILTFAINYNVKYNKDMKNISDKVWGIPPQKLTNVAQKFFGMPVTIHDINNCKLETKLYSEPLYIVPKATSLTSVFSKVDFLMDNGDETYLANVVIYMGSSQGYAATAGSRFRALITKTPTGYNLKEYIMR